MLTTIRERREFSIPFVKELGRKWIFYSGCKPNQPALISCPIMEQLPSSEVLRVIMCVYLLFLCRVCVQVDVTSLLKLLCYTFIKCRKSSFVYHELLEKLDCKSDLQTLINIWIDKRWHYLLMSLVDSILYLDTFFMLFFVYKISLRQRNFIQV